MSFPSTSSPNPSIYRTWFLVSSPYRESVSGHTSPPPRPYRTSVLGQQQILDRPCGSGVGTQPNRVRHSPSRNDGVIFEARERFTCLPCQHPDLEASPRSEGNLPPQDTTDTLHDQDTKQPTPVEGAHPVSDSHSPPQPAHTITECTPTPRHSSSAAYTGDRLSFTYPCSMGALLFPAETHHNLITAMQSECRKRACSVHGELAFS